MSALPHPAADAIVARIRELAQSHGVLLEDDIELRELVAALQLGDRIPIGAFAVATNLLFHLLAADRRSHSSESGQ